MTKVEIGARIREAREAKNLTQESLAALCEVRRMTIIDIEKGRNTTLDTLLQVAAPLELTVQVRGISSKRDIPR